MPKKTKTPLYETALEEIIAQREKIDFLNEQIGDLLVYIRRARFALMGADIKKGKRIKMALDTLEVALGDDDEDSQRIKVQIIERMSKPSPFMDLIEKEANG